jgi:hypothetical protein
MELAIVATFHQLHDEILKPLNLVFQELFIDLQSRFIHSGNILYIRTRPVKKTSGGITIIEVIY